MYCAAAKRVERRTLLTLVERAKLQGRIYAAAYRNGPLPPEAESNRRRPAPEPTPQPIAVPIEAPPEREPEPVPEPEPKRLGGRLHLMRLGWVYTCHECNDFRGPYTLHSEAVDAERRHKAREHPSVELSDLSLTDVSSPAQTQYETTDDLGFSPIPVEEMQ